jgi:hypothetical protein
MAIGDLSVRKRSLLPLAAGLLTAQGISTLFVWDSNARMQQSVDAIETAGWLAVPAGPAAATLDTLGAAFWGGLFFTLSTGAGLALATWAALYLWRWLFRGSPRLLGLLAAIWLVSLAAVNARGWVLFPSLLVLCVPLATAAAAMHRPAAASGRPAGRWMVSLLTLVLLAVIWATQFEPQAFSTVRDHLLLSNPMGRTVNDFYYRYTLYAAEAFKSFDQKTLRTWRLEAGAHTPAARRLASVLANNDVLETPRWRHADLTVRPLQTRLLFVSSTGKRLEIEQGAFFSDPNRWLRAFSETTDRYATFRQMTFAGLLFGFPILLYVAIHGVVGRITDRLLQDRTAAWVAAAVCLAVGLLLFVPILAARPQAIPAGALGTALASGDWRQRVAALRQAEKERIDISGFDQYRVLLNSPRVAERYWLARALAFSRNAATHADLLALMHDPHPNVVCQAYYALGRRGDRSAITVIKDRMVQSDHWYTQWYGYRALRGLGWRQTRSTSAL